MSTITPSTEGDGIGRDALQAELRYTARRVRRTLGPPRAGRPPLYDRPFDYDHVVAFNPMPGLAKVRVFCLGGCDDERIEALMDVADQHWRGAPPLAQYESPGDSTHRGDDLIGATDPPQPRLWDGESPEGSTGGAP